MNKGRIRLLVAALESGLYEQGQNCLVTVITDEEGHEHRKYCCLGVAGDVAIRFGARISREVVRRAYGEEVLVVSEKIGGHTLVMSDDVMDWYGFTSANPQLAHNGTLRRATYLNDAADLSLQQIADAFRRTFLEESCEAGG